MEKKHIHVQHSRLSNSVYLGSCRGSESRFHLRVILFFGVLSICLLIGLLVANAQYNDVKRQLTEDLQVLNKSHDSKISEIKQLEKTLDEKSAELNRALAAQNSDSKCNSNEEFQSNLTKRLLACNELLFNITEQRDLLNNRLIESPKEGINGRLSEQNNSVFNMTEENKLPALLVNLTASRQEVEKNLSFLSIEKDPLNNKLGETTKELLQFCNLFENATCPYKWLTFNCSCYQISGNGSWDEGRADCIRQGGDLVVINNPEEQNFLAEFELEAWIGLSDRETEGSWLWVDGTTLNFTSWRFNQPDNGGGDPIKIEDCAHMLAFTGSPWNDVSCNATKRWICEKNPTMFAP